jgi:hypothetical protein
MQGKLSDHSILSIYMLAFENFEMLNNLSNVSKFGKYFIPIFLLAHFDNQITIMMKLNLIC